MLLPDVHLGLPYWSDPKPPIPELADRPPEKVDILIIGGGYTGLSAAISAHDAGASVAVLDAIQPGQGASTRNGGMFGAHPRLGWDALAKSFGADTADGVFSEVKSALSDVRELIARENIDCEHQQVGRVSLAWTKTHLENQKRVAESLQEKTDIDVRMVERADLEQEIRTECYFGGMVLPEHGGLHPRKLHEGLLCAVLERGIPVVPHCPVRTCQKTATGFLAETPAGLIRVEKIVLATGGYATSNFTWARRHVFALPSFLIATEPLDPDVINRLAPGRRMMVETRARHSYYRISPDGSRILWGGRAAMRPLGLEKAAARLQATMAEVWPDMANVGLSHVWTGNTGYAFNHTPWVGEIEGVHYAMGYSGSGTVMAPYLGTKVGLRAAGAEGGETAFSGTHLRPSWLNPTGNPFFLYAADFWYHNWVDRRETALRRRA